MNQNISPELYELRKRIRHSAAHVMADVTTKMFPEAKLAIGPPTDDGFYYDFLITCSFFREEVYLRLSISSLTPVSLVERAGVRYRKT